MKAAAAILLIFAPVAVAVGFVILVADALSPTFTFSAPAGYLFLGGILALLAGAGLLRQARIRASQRWWQP